ncbi:MAG: S41 family peptidase [Planctomycetota bacterium]|jgi:carboxyl-terminal processing protease
MVVRAAPPASYYGRPVVVLMDVFCFSATDIFLGALDGLRNVTLLGVPSGGGSGRSQAVRLRHSGFDVRVSSMASFQPDGKLYDGNGVAPDVLVEPQATDWIGRTDTMLEAALKRLR